MSMPTPPGLLSPFPFPAAFPLPNEPLTPGLPYLIGNALGTAAAVTVTAVAGSGAGDTIVVIASASSGGAALPVSITDTEANSYSLTQTLGFGGGRTAQYSAVSPVPLKPGDSVTVTWAGGSIHNVAVVGLPGAAAGVPGGNLIPDALAATSANGLTVMQASIAAASLSASAEVAIAYAVVFPAATTGPLNWPPDWTVLTSGSITSGGTATMSVACKVQAAKTKVAPGLLLAGIPTSSGLVVSTYMPETRYAPALPFPTPPGMLSPAAFPFTPITPQVVNDVPFPPGSPYLVARILGFVNSAVTIQVQNPTNPGDAICVMVGNYGNAAQPVSCTDTQGNTYSLNGLSANTFNGFHAIAVNATPLTAADTITVTMPVSVFFDGIVLGCPAATIQSPVTSYLVPAATGSVQAAGAAAVTSAAALSQPVLLIVTLSANSNNAANLVLQNSSGSGAWNVTGTSFNPNDTQCVLAAWRIVPRVAAGQVIAAANAAGLTCVLRFTALIPETRFAPNRPAPDMPPGMQSPGAWQYAPLRPSEGPASVKYASSPYKWTETLPAAAVAAPAMTRSTGKKTPATPHAAGALARGTAKNLPATPHPAGKLTRSAAKHLTATAHPAGKLTRTTGKLLAAAVTARGALTRVIPRTYAATAHATGKLVKSTGKHLPATAHPTGKLTRATRKILTATPRTATTLGRGFTLILAAAVRVAVRIFPSTPAPVFTLGVPGTEWAVSISAIGMSHLSTQYILVPVAATRAGTPYNPMSDPVQFAFMPAATQVPQNSDWVTGTWEANTASLIYPYTAKCLAGPAGTVTLGLGTYIMYLKVSDSPDIPVLVAGQLQIS